MLNFLKSIFTWWNGATIGARFHIGRRGGRRGLGHGHAGECEEQQGELEGQAGRHRTLAYFGVQAS